MSETILTREQIEDLAFDAKAASDHYVQATIDPPLLKALCTIALSSIAMREALEPFAALADDYASTPDHHVGRCLVRHLRRAAEAYQEQGK